MLKVIPAKWSYAFSVTDGVTEIAQAVDASWWRDKGELRIGDELYTARRDKSSYVLESKSGVLVRANQPRRWRSELILEHEGRRYTLRRKSLFQGQFVLLEGSTQIGTLAPDGVFTRKTAVELPKTFPLHLQVFIIWLVMTLWKHEDSSGG